LSPAPTTAVFDYTDAAGGYLFSVLVERQDGGGKNVRQGVRQVDGGYVWSMNGRPRVLYRLHELFAHLSEGSRDPVYVVEGERDVETLRVHGLTATTNPMGAGKWRAEHTDSLAGARHVVIIADRDEPGRSHARAIAAALAGSDNTPDRIDVREPPADHGEHADVSDLLGAGRSLEELVPLEPSPEQENEDAGPPSARFTTGRDFLKLDLPAAVPLLGATDDAYLPRGGWLNAYGQAGSSKTTLGLDLVCHLAAGTPWLELPVPAPVRVALIVNEGPPALLQAKVAHKARTWLGPDFLDRLFVYVSPWGYFSFSNPAHREALRAFCREHEIAVVYADPLQLIGAPGSGTPEETALFRGWLIECGLMNDLAFITAHHENKSGQMSGAYEGHSDTTLHIEQSGNAGTRLTWRKIRHADTPNPRRWELAWEPECRGFRRLELPAAVSDDELLHEVDAYLGEHPAATTTAVVEALGKRADRVRSLLNANTGESGRYAVEKGPKGAKLWSLRNNVVRMRQDDRDDLLFGEDGNPHE
jgi:5S rRNA maturation endonuclease (ribonuclease M5)